ncbi:Cell division cycle protein 27 homolog, partial [Geodia barretti]
MAHVCFSQERYKLAEVYISKALGVNKSSAICCTQLALVQFRQRNHVGALRLLDTAAQLSHSNPIPRFHKAKVLESLGQNEEALQQLEELSRSWPKEPNIYISIGKLLKKLKRPHEAVLNFSWALDFSRHGTNSHIREEVDEMYQVSEAEGRNAEDDFFVHHSTSEDPSQLEEEEGGGGGGGGGYARGGRRELIKIESRDLVLASLNGIVSLSVLRKLSFAVKNNHMPCITVTYIVW